MSERPSLKNILEGALLAAGGPLTLETLASLFVEEEAALPSPTREDLTAALTALDADYQDRGIELAQVAGGFRIQVRQSCAPWLARLWDEKPPRYSRALLETLALIAYRQPITRGEIEEVRGVAVSTNIVKTLTEREWIRVIGHRDVPGRPALYATTRKFLDYFGLKSLNELPTLAEIRAPDFLGDDLPLEEPDPAASGASANDPSAGSPLASTRGMSANDPSAGGPLLSLSQGAGPPAASAADLTPAAFREPTPAGGGLG